MSVVSKNPFDLLGDGESPAAPAAAPKKQAPKPAAAAPARRGGNDAAFRDKNAGRENNRGKPTDESGARRGRGGPRGGRGSRFPREKDDRHSKSVGGPGEKQADKAWGANEGNAELKDEIAGEEIAAADKTEEEVAEAAEPEEKVKSFDDFLAEKAEKKLALGESLSLRQANEGTKANKKWETAKQVINEESDYFTPGTGKATRQRERKVKQTIDIEPRFVEAERSSRSEGGRGGRGGPRGGFRGEGRGGRGGARGGPRSAAPGPGPRAAKQAINTSDEAAFPSLGA
ncbi:Suppressor protein STM1 [Ceratocystis platani]|uniref:Suppressor protein STM1 n=1 Tax=Ceratocystis fimbriata f. sp. platani TaxID=88771 RepID=A0A0F8D8Y3_CERFI|nr:Suppressor protein STM1 [Ceratocystis platani]